MPYDVNGNLCWIAVRRIDFEIIRTMVVYPVLLQVRPAFANGSIATEAFATLDFLHGAMHAHQENVVRLQQMSQIRSPLWELDNVFDDEIVAGCGERGDTPMEAIEKPWPNVAPPEKRALFVAPFRQAWLEKIRRKVQERFVNRELYRLCERRFAGARRSIQQDDASDSPGCGEIRMVI